MQYLTWLHKNVIWNFLRWARESFCSHTSHNVQVGTSGKMHQDEPRPDDKATVHIKEITFS